MYFTHRTKKGIYELTKLGTGIWESFKTFRELRNRMEELGITPEQMA